MSFGKMNTFIDIVEQRKTKDPEGFAATEDVVVASLRAYREGQHGSEKWASLRPPTSSDSGVSLASLLRLLILSAVGIHGSISPAWRT